MLVGLCGDTAWGASANGCGWSLAQAAAAKKNKKDVTDLKKQNEEDTSGIKKLNQKLEDASAGARKQKISITLLTDQTDKLTKENMRLIASYNHLKGPKKHQTNQPRL